MAVQEITPADANALVDSICDFAQYALGWARSGRQITPPGGASGFLLDDQVANFSNLGTGTLTFAYITVDLVNYHVPEGIAPEDVPTPRGTCNWLSPISRAFLFGGDDPTPWLHVAVETAPNYYMHLYFGRLERYGDWTGGAIFSGTSWFARDAAIGMSDSRSWDAGLGTSNSYGPYLLFHAKPGTRNTADHLPGFLEVNHPAAPMPVFRFENARRHTRPCVTGGFGTAYNGLLSAVPGNAFDGSVSTQPIILFHLDADSWSVPMGRVSGVRMINTTNFAEGEIIDFAGETYQVFPLCNKRVAYASPGATSTAIFGPGENKTAGGSRAFNIGGGTEFWGVAVRRES